MEFNFIKKVDLEKLGEEYKGIVLEFKKPNLGQTLVFGKLAEDTSNADSINDILVDLYVGNTPTKEQFKEHFLTFDVVSLIFQKMIPANTEDDFLLKKQS
jgi:hypothetical protein